MRWQRIRFLFLLALLLGGCLPSGPQIQTNGVHGAFNYTVQLWSNTACPQINQTITLRAKVTNDGAQPEIADAKGQPVFDIVVQGQSETVRWSDGKPLTLELTRLELKPGEFKSIQMQFPYKGGDYAVTARFIYDTEHANGSVTSSLMLRQWCGGY